MLWLPDLPADLRWVQGVLRSLALGVYSRTKDQLIGLVKVRWTGVAVLSGGGTRCFPGPWAGSPYNPRPSVHPHMQPPVHVFGHRCGLDPCWTWMEVLTSHIG